MNRKIVFSLGAGALAVAAVGQSTSAPNVRGFARNLRASWNKTANMHVIEITT